MTTKQTHSPLPWKVGKRLRIQSETSGKGQLVICDEGSIQVEANAGFICLAVNNHEKLVAALKAVLEEHGLHKNDDILSAQALLSQIEEQSK